MNFNGKQEIFQNISSKNQKPIFQEIESLLSARNPQTLQYLRKVEMVKQNLKVYEELTKRVYSVCKNFESFYALLCFLLNYNPKYKEIIEEKALIIANQMIKVDIQVNSKELFSIQLFLNVQTIILKDYYPIAFDQVRPRLLKMLTPDTNIHALAIMFCYGFGTEKAYSHKIYEDYGRVLMKEYNSSPFDLKKLYQYTEKMKNVYSNLDPATRNNKFKHLIMEVSNSEKRQKWIRSLQVLVEKSDSMSIFSLSQEFINNVTTLAKGMR